MGFDVKSSLRTFQILEFFAQTQKPARVGEIQIALDAPQSSISKLLQSLSSRGYLEYDPDTRSYFPTFRVTMLGNWLNQSSFGNALLINITDELYERFGSKEGIGTSVIIGVQNDTQVMYVLERPFVAQHRPPVAMGMLRPLCVAGAGKALMMLKSDQEAGLLIRRINSQIGAENESDATQLINPHLFLEEMRMSRDRGYALSHGEVIPGSGAIAVPLPPIPHQPRMALGIGAALDVIERRVDEMVEALTEKQKILMTASARNG